MTAPETACPACAARGTPEAFLPLTGASGRRHLLCPECFYEWEIPA